jgi:exodeoxyribonuclease V beta subunit
MTTTPFDPLTTALSGIHLIEASAGTGKTHTLEILFTRLVIEKKFPVNQILVVTFTEAATEELRDRIRKQLYEILLVFKKNDLEHEKFGQLLKNFQYKK